MIGGRRWEVLSLTCLTSLLLLSCLIWSRILDALASLGEPFVPDWLTALTNSLTHSYKNHYKTLSICLINFIKRLKIFINSLKTFIKWVKMFIKRLSSIYTRRQSANTNTNTIGGEGMCDAGHQMSPSNLPTDNCGYIRFPYCGPASFDFNLIIESAVGGSFP